MALQTSGAISISELATEYGDTTPNSMSEFYAGGSLVNNDYKNIHYDELYGYNGSPSLGTRYPDSSSFSYSWHNRTFSGDQSSWGTSHVRETDEVVAYLKSSSVYANRLGWKYSGNSAYTTNPYYFRITVTGHHRTSDGGTILTGTHYYTGSISLSESSEGQAVFTRRSGNPGTPNSTSINNGSTSQLEGSIVYLWDLQDCSIDWHFNSYQPGTSSASFSFHWTDGININPDVPTSGVLSLTDFYGGQSL